MRDESRRIRVLVADDSAVIRRLLSSQHERGAGVEVEEIADFLIATVGFQSQQEETICRE